MKKIFEFKGVPSGDYESFVFAVDKETFLKIKTDGDASDEVKFELLKYFKHPFKKDMYMLYPDDFFNGGDILDIKIEINK